MSIMRALRPRRAVAELLAYPLQPLVAGIP